MQSKSRTKKHGKYVSIGITIAVVIMMVLSGPVSAVSLGIADLDGTTHTKGASVSFDVTATIEDTDSYVPIDSFSLNISGATDKGIIFSTDGDVLSGDSGITVEAVTVPSSTYGQGVGYGYDSGLGYGYDFAYGYGYGYGYGAGGEDVVYEYTITLDTAILNTGVYEAVLSLNTGDSAKPSFESSSATFTIKSKSSGGSSGGSGGAYVVPADDTEQPEDATDETNGDDSTDGNTDSEDTEGIDDTTSDELPATAEEPSGLPGFEAVFAIAGLLAVAFIVRRKDLE